MHAGGGGGGRTGCIAAERWIEEGEGGVVVVATVILLMFSLLSRNPPLVCKQSGLRTHKPSDVVMKCLHLRLHFDRKRISLALLETKFIIRPNQIILLNFRKG